MSKLWIPPALNSKVLATKEDLQKFLNNHSKDLHYEWTPLCHSISIRRVEFRASSGNKPYNYGISVSTIGKPSKLKNVFQVSAGETVTFWLLVIEDAVVDYQ